MAGQKPSGRRSASTKQSPVRPGSPTARPATASKRPAAGKPRAATSGRPDTARSASATGNRNEKSRATANGATAGAKATDGAKARTAVTPAPPTVPPRGLGALWSPFRSMGALPLATLILSLYGLGASIYLTIAHFDSHVSLICSDKGLINCEEVTTSSQSMVFGVLPVAVLGLAFYIFMVAVNSPWGWRLNWPAVRWLRLGSVIAGMGFVLYLIYAELDQIHAICLWCTSVHVATFLIFALLIFHAAFSWETSTARGDNSVH
jgi:uncharacterized membrane protein